MRLSIRRGLAVFLLHFVCSVATAADTPPNNLILFITDGLRSQIVDEKTAPTLHRLREEGVNFVNSHSVFPTFTTANASAFATGHHLGDTGDFSNYIYTGFPVQSSGGTPTPFLELDPVLREVNEHFGDNYLNEEAIVAAAQRHKISTALVGKLGPTAIFHLQAMGGAAGDTLIIDDSTGSKEGVPIPQEWLDAMKAAGVKPAAPSRGANGNAGNNTTPGTWIPNLAQQQYFMEMAVRVILPKFKAANRPFVLVFWSREPDGSQHNHGDSLGSLTPGINGPTSLAGIRVADMALGALEQALKFTGLAQTTNIVVAADHGFATISKESRTSEAAKATYADTTANELPLGFLAIDVAHGLQKKNPKLRLFDPDNRNTEVQWTAGEHPKHGNGIIASDSSKPQVVVVANGGSDLIYLADTLSRRTARTLARQIVATLVQQDYVSGVFVDTRRFGDMPGALSTADINLVGKARTPVPALVVNFASRTTGCEKPTNCTVIIADTALQTGQGMHGSFSRAETWNFMAARGPDFRTKFANPMPASNADIGRTVAHLLQLDIEPAGPLAGRVLSEALNTSSSTEPSPTTTAVARTLESRPAANGLKTILKYQTVGEHRYLDAAGFPGRTVGLD